MYFTKLKQDMGVLEQRRNRTPPPPDRSGSCAGRLDCWGSSHSHIDSNREIGNSGRRAEPDSIPQKVPVGRGYGKYRDSRWGIDCAVAYEQEGAASRSLTVCGYLGE